MNRVIEFQLKGHPPVFIYEDDYENSDGPLMSTATQDRNYPFSGLSYAYLFPDESIQRNRVIIGHRDDLTQLHEIKA